jgi:hypothetical protein
MLHGMGACYLSTWQANLQHRDELSSSFDALSKSLLRIHCFALLAAGSRCCCSPTRWTRCARCPVAFLRLARRSARFADFAPYVIALKYALLSYRTLPIIAGKQTKSAPALVDEQLLYSLRVLPALAD